MKNLKILLVFFILSLVSIKIFAQESHLKATFQNKNGATMFRWAVDSPELWLHGMKNGYSIIRQEFLVQNKDLKIVESKTLNISPILPADSNIWKSKMDENKYVMMAAQLIFGENIDLSIEQGGIFLAAQIEDADKNRFNMMLLCADRDYETAILSGLAYIDSTAAPNKNYLYKIVLHNSGDSAMLLVNTAEKTMFMPIENISAKTDDLQCVISWSIKDLSRYYSDYIVERRKKGEKTFKVVIEDVIGNSNLDKEIVSFMDILPEYGNEYEYRLRGYDIFGTKGPYSEIIKVSAKKKFLIAPHNFELTNIGEKSVFKWNFPDSIMSYVKEFVICRQKSVDSDYEEVERISNLKSRQADASKHLTKDGYYCVAAKFSNDDIQYSNFVFYQKIDSIAPNKATALKASVDTNNIVRLTWKKNQENDIDGYRVFRANNQSYDFVQITTAAVGDTFFVDTLAQNRTNSVFYKIKVCDKRGNESEFSDIVEVKPPKQNKPTAPQFVKFENKTNAVEIVWANNMKTENTVIFYNEETANNFKEIFRTKVISAIQSTTIDWADRKSLTLAIRCVNSDSVFSDFSGKLSLQHNYILKKPKFKASVDRDKRQINLSWQLDKTDNIKEIQIFRHKNNETMDILNIISSNQKQYEDKKLEINNHYYYAVKYISADNTHSPISDIIEVVY